MSETMGNVAERLSADVDILDLCSKLEQAAINVENARMSAIAEHLAGWEHLTIRHAIRSLRARHALALSKGSDV